MLYLIDGKYYINTSPLRYTEVLLSKKNGEGVISITKNRIEVSERTNIIPVTFAKEIEKISEPKKQENTKKNDNVVVRSTRSRNKKFNNK